jgi:hypothetical protein
VRGEDQCNLSNVFSDEKKKQVLAPGQFGWLARIPA